MKYLIITILLFATNSFAAEVVRKAAPAARPAPAAPAQNVGQWVIVKTDSAMVYEQPNLDGSVMIYLPAGQKLRASKKQFGDYYKFYRVKTPDNKIGYILIIDVVTETQIAKHDGGKPGKKPKASKEKVKPLKSVPFMETRYLGVVVGNLAYHEVLPGVPASETVLMYGLKITGPGTVIGPGTDINILVHSGAPSFYSSFSKAKPSGYMIMADFLLLFPIMERKSTSFYVGAGPMIDYSSFKFSASTGIVDSTDFSIGAAIEGGFGFKVSTDWAIRAEGKYMWERTNEWQYQLAIQDRF